MRHLWENFLGGHDLIELATFPRFGWRHHAARGLLACDLTAPGPADLTGAKEARFFCAAADWIRGDEAGALGKLEGLTEFGAARELARLIAKDRIEVLSFLPRPTGTSMHNLADAALHDQKFWIRNVSSAIGDTPNVPGLSIRQLTQDRRPDFIIAEMVEWHVLPRDLQDFSGPLIGHTSDFDMHVQGCLPYLRLFDFVMTVGRQEWRKLAGLIGREHTQPFPLPFSLPDIPLPENGPRDLDFVMTGTVFGPSQRDKEQFVKDIITYPELNYILYNGSMDVDHYWNLLRSSRLTTSFIRHADSLPTRALEALAAGTSCMVAPDSALNLYVPEGHGLIALDHTHRDDLHRKIRAVTRTEVDRFAAEAALGNDLIRKVFHKSRICSVYMRFCTVVAALIAAGEIRRGRAPRPITQKRPVSWIGWLPANGDKDAIETVRVHNRELALQARDQPDYWRFNEVGRDAILDYELRTRRQRQRPDEALVHEALEAFRNAITADPDALAPAVNFVRAAYHHGDAAERLEADGLAVQIVLRPRDRWVITREDDLMTYDFYPTHADTRRFVDLMTDWESSREADGSASDLAREALIDALLASVHLYLGWRHESLNSYRAAFALAPQFLEIRLGLAGALIETEDREAVREARDHLAAIASTYIVSSEIPALAARAARFLGENVEQVSIQTDLGYRCLDRHGDHYADFEGVIHATSRRFAETTAEIRRRPSETAPSTSVIILERHRDQRERLAAFDQQKRHSNADVQLIDCEAFARLGDTPPDWCDVAIRPNVPIQLIEHCGRLLTFGFREASGDILVFAERLDGISLDRLLAAAKSIKARPETLAAAAWPEAGSPWPQIVVITRDLFLHLEGFDLSTACQGPRGGVRELVWRARNSGYEILDLGRDDLGSADWAPALSLSNGRLRPIAGLFKISDKSNWDDPTRTRPFWPAADLRLGASQTTSSK